VFSPFDFRTSYNTKPDLAQIAFYYASLAIHRDCVHGKKTGSPGRLEEVGYSAAWILLGLIGARGRSLLGEEDKRKLIEPREWRVDRAEGAEICMEKGASFAYVSSRMIWFVLSEAWTSISR
jgi:hypothetical protein